MKGCSCKLETSPVYDLSVRDVYLYSVAYRLDSQADVSKQFIYIGIGRIWSCDDIAYESDMKFKFYAVQRKIAGWKRPYR